MPLELEPLTGAIIGAAIEVHRTLGPGFLEAVYEAALVVELMHRDIPFQRQVTVPIFYRGAAVGTHRLDLLVEARVVVELKACKSLLPEHFAVVRSYLRAVGHQHGLLLHFAAPTLEVKRVLAR